MLGAIGSTRGKQDLLIANRAARGRLSGYNGNKKERHIVVLAAI
jgi:hypothetical protein